MRNKLFKLVFVLLTLIAVGILGVIYYKNISSNWGNQSLGGNQSIQTKKQISTVIIPHHDLVKDKRDDLLKKVSQEIKPKTIIIVSPNHFDTGNSDFIITDKTWQILDAKVYPDQGKIEELVSNKLVTNDEAAFSREHGITNLLEPINKNFPEVKIIPIIIKQDASQDTTNALAQEIYKVCADQCLLIASVDFSHYQPGALAEIHDNLSIRALTNLDNNLIWQAEVDSRQSLAIASGWAKLNKTENFQLQENINSGKIANERDAESTSYVFGWYQAEDPSTSLRAAQDAIEHSATFMVGGDMMFDRLVDYRFPGDKLVEAVSNLGERFFWGTDISLVNLEGPISPEPIKPDITPTNLVFNFPPKTTGVLQWLYINTVSLANNHSGNAGAAGLEYTKKVLLENKINCIGQQSEFNNESVKRFATNQQKISIVAINLLDDDKDLTEVIKKEKADGYFVFIFPHWGNEYQTTHSSNQQSTAHAWIDAGADLIIGSHPHVIEDAEIYHDKPIFYSLGNLLFDQTFSAETQRGLVIAGKVTNDKLQLVLLPTISKNLKPELLAGAEKTKLIDRFRKDLGLEISNKDYGYDTIEINR